MKRTLLKLTLVATVLGVLSGCAVYAEPGYYRPHSYNYGGGYYSGDRTATRQFSHRERTRRKAAGCRSHRRLRQRPGVLAMPGCHRRADLPRSQGMNQPAESQCGWS